MVRKFLEYEVTEKSEIVKSYTLLYHSKENITKEKCNKS